MFTPKNYIFDFDSTFIQVESLDILAEIGLANHAEKESRLSAIRDITHQAMEGHLSYAESLRERFALLNLTNLHLQQAIDILKHKISPSFARNHSFFRKNANNIYVFSGAFIEILWPILHTFGLKRENIHGNRLLYDFEGVCILGIRSKTEITAEVIQNLPQLEAIGAFCIGTNQIDLAACSSKGIAAFNAPFSNTRSVVELAIGEIILLLRRAACMNNQLLKGIWHKSSHGAHEVRGKILGIIGYGNIGSQLSILAEALGMQVIYYDIEDKLPLGNAKVCHTLEMLLNTADVVTLHVDGRKENHHLIGANEFDMMKDGAIFLNLSRGFIVDYEALLHALNSGKISGVGVDVYPQEPDESKGNYQTPLQKFDNVIITPHIGGSTEEAQQSIGEYVSKNLHAYMTDGTSLGSVNFPQLNLPSVNYPQRIIHIHRNVPGIMAQMNGLFAQYQSNIEGQFLKTNDDVGYAITDINRELSADILTRLKSIPNTIKVRILDKE